VPHDPKMLLNEIDRLRLAFGEIPARAAEARQQAAHARTLLDNAKTLMDEHEAETLSLVSAEPVDATSSKLKYTNQAARDAETSRRLAVDEEFKRLRTHFDEAQRVKTNTDMRVLQLQDEEKALERQLDAIGLQLRAEMVRSFVSVIAEFNLSEARRLVAPKGAV